MSAPSIPFPETLERGAGISREIHAATGLDEETLERLVRAFYGAARRDEVLGPLFERLDDGRHIARICAFWSRAALMPGRYHGQPMAAHLPLGLEPDHFEHWLALFEGTARATC